MTPTDGTKRSWRVLSFCSRNRNGRADNAAANPYFPGTENHKNWTVECGRPHPDPAEQSAKCDRFTNSPCPWSKTHPRDHTCVVCKVQFPGWGA